MCAVATLLKKTEPPFTCIHQLLSSGWALKNHYPTLADMLTGLILYRILCREPQQIWVHECLSPVWSIAAALPENHLWSFLFSAVAWLGVVGWGRSNLMHSTVYVLMRVESLYWLQSTTKGSFFIEGYHHHFLLVSMGRLLLEDQHRCQDSHSPPQLNNLVSVLPFCLYCHASSEPLNTIPDSCFHSCSPSSPSCIRLHP